MCGSPTVIWKFGFAACSRLTLGCMELRTGLGWAACTGGGCLGPVDWLKPSSSSMR